MSISPISLSSAVLLELVNSATRAIVLAGVAGLGLAIFRVKSVSLRLFVWSSVLYAALLLPFLGQLIPPLSVAAPGFLGQPGVPHSSVATKSTDALTADAMPSPGLHERSRAGSTTSKVASQMSPPRQSTAIEPNAGSSPLSFVSSLWASIPWSVLAVLIYAAVAFALLLQFVLGLLLTHRLVRRSRRITDARVAACLALAMPSDASRAAESASVSVPVTVGALWPTILLPTGWREWDDARLLAVLTHELSHVARRDALMQRLSLLHRTVFWFSPLAWWLDRHLASLAEQASDEAALSRGADRNAYARTLLDFFAALPAASGRIRWQGVSMAKAGQAEQRLERILAWKGTIPMKVKKSITIAIIALAVPAVYLVAAVRPTGASSGSQAAPVASAPRPPQAPSAGMPALPGPPPLATAPGAPSIAISTEPAIAPAAPAATVIAGVPPVAALAPQARAIAPGGFSYRFGDDDDDRYVIVFGKTDSYTMSGSTQDVRHVEKLKQTISGDFIWFQRDEKSYIIRDQATVNRAKAFWAPQEELGKKQAELGKQQEALGAQQEQLGKKMEEVRVNVPDMTADLDRLKAKLQQMGPTATVDQIGELQSEIGELQSKIGEFQSQAGDAQSKLGEQQGELGEKQGKLGELQGKLGEQQAEQAEKATRQMKQLLDDAIKNGTATPEAETVKTPSL